MNTSEILLLVQDVILFFTALILYWYTVETKKIREASLEQNRITRNQLELTQQANARARIKDNQECQPIFGYAGRSASAEQTTVKFKNIGAVVKNISVKTIPELTVHSNPKTLEQNGELSICIDALSKTDEKPQVLISYLRQDNETDSKSFEWDENVGYKEIIL